MELYREFLEIAQQHGSPFYLFDREAFVRNFEDIRDAFEKRYPRLVIGYSYKTNYIPYVCRLARDLGGHAEVVSRLELDLALAIGCPPAAIIFNGPVKTAADLEFALTAGVLVNLDTLRELEAAVAFARQHPEQTLRIGLRLNIPLRDEEGQSHLQNGLPHGRFGFPESLLAAVARLLTGVPNLHVCSLHGHTSSSSRSPWVYRTIVARLLAAGERYFPESVEFINIGGGYYGRRVPAMGLTDTPTYDDYAAAVCAVLHDNPWVAAKRPHLVIEPGMAVTADSLSFVTQVFEVKKIENRHLAVVDGTVFNVKPTLHPRNHPFILVTPRRPDGARELYSVVGATCMEKDRLLQEIASVPIERGDFIRIDNVGAYTVVLTPPFIHPAPAIVARGPNGIEAIRRRQDFSDFFRSYIF